MKKLHYLILLSGLFGCNQNNGTSEEENSIMPLLTMGNEADMDSRAGWEFQRLHNPNTGEIPVDIREQELAFAQTLPSNQKRAYSWEWRGPYNIGGRTRALAIDVLNSDVWIAGGVTGGIWRSENAGNTWTKVTTNDQLHSITAVCQDTRPGKENIWYAGTGEHYAIVSASTFEARFSGDGLLKSEDNGLTWTTIDATTSSTPDTYLNNGDMDFIWRIVTDPSDLTNDVVLAAAYNGIFYSNDGGDSWSESIGFTAGPLSNPYCDYLDLVVTSTGVFYATFSSDGPSKGVYRSEDGLTWANITPPSFPTSYGRITIAINPQDETELWFFGQANTGFANNHLLMKYNYVSGDGSGAGGIWDDRSMNLPDEDCDITGFSSNLAELNTQSSFDVHVAVHPTDPDVIYIAGTSIWRSTDGFSSIDNYTWIGGYGCTTMTYDDLDFQTSYPNHHPDQHVLLFHPDNPDILVNANDGGVYQTVDNLADSVQWISLNNGYLTTQFYAVAIEPGETTSDIIIGGMQDNNTWYTNNTVADSAWVRLSGGDGMYCAIAENEDFYLTSLQYGRLFLGKLDADGDVLEAERIDPESGPSTYNWANSFKLDPNNTNILYWNARNRVMRVDVSDIIIEGDKVNKEPDHWENVLNSNVPPGSGIISDLEMCKAAPNTVWYGTNSGDVYRIDSANTADPILTNITGEDFHPAGYVSCVAVNPEDPNRILVSFANYGIKSIFKTIDGGETWEHISGNLEEDPSGDGRGPAVFWVEYYPGGILFAGTSVGLFTTRGTDGDDTIWELENDLGNVVINHMDYRTHDGFFVVGTHGNGVFSTHLPPVFVGVDSEKTMSSSVYPTITQSTFTIETSVSSVYNIYNLQGQIVHTGKVIEGKNIVSVNHLTKGQYIISLEENNTTHRIIIP